LRLPSKKTAEPDLKPQPKKNSRQFLPSPNQKERRPSQYRSPKLSPKKIETHNKIYSKMLADEFVLLNEKIENIFHSTRPNNPVQNNINKYIKRSPKEFIKV